MSAYVDKPISLIEKKKQQWAKEREELAGLCAPWSSPPIETNQISFDNKSCLQRNRYVPKLAMPANPEFFRKECPSSRRSSLPPLYKNQYNSVDRDIERGGETSGYGSDNNHIIQENPSTGNQHNQQIWNQSGYESSSSCKDDRAKWRDQSSGIGNRFWNGKENEPPNWVKRGLQTDEEIVVSNTSPAESPQHDDFEADRPYTSQSTLNKTHVRGQNCPIDSAEIAERERRRQIALAHQDAIRQQLEEREQRRKAEKQRRIKEEQEEELRIEREQEIERQRKEQELARIREKQERERKRKEALEEALELAEKSAKSDKLKARMTKQTADVEDLNNAENAENKTEVDKNNLEEKADKETIESENKKYEKSINNLGQRNNLTASPRPEGLINNLEVKGNKTLNTTPKVENDANARNPPSFQILSTPKTENVAIVLQTPIEHLQNMQYAVLMQSIAGASPKGIPIAVPLTVCQPERANTASFSTNTENRVLTPTQYRNKKSTLRDSSTQTDFFNDFPTSAFTDTADESTNNNPKYPKDTNNNLNRSRAKERRARSEDCNVERPKWGANRPPTRYMKQSEKDPVYQRRKLRQKMRDGKSYDYKNSSDESQTGSPRTYRKRAVWRKSDRFFARNIRMYQTEIVPLELDKERIYYRKCDCCCRCNCNCSSSGKGEVLKIDHDKGLSDSLVPLMRNNDDRLPDCNAQNASYILDKLTSLHNSLLSKREQWERSPRTPSLSSSTRKSENN